MSDLLLGRNAIITGANQGLGLAIARAYVERLRIDAARRGIEVLASEAVAAASVRVGLSRTQELP